MIGAVSPATLPMLKITPVRIPGKAVGKTIFFIVPHLVAPNDNEASRIDIGTADNASWLEEMINSEAQLREKMSLFWHGHFATRVINSYFQQYCKPKKPKNNRRNTGQIINAYSD